LRGIDILLEEDLNVRVVALPEPEDPDSFVKEKGAAALREYITKNVSDFILFKTRLLLKDAGNDPFKKAEVIKDIVASISIIPDAIKRSIFLKECSHLLSVDENVLISETNKLARTRLSKEANISKREAAMFTPTAEAKSEQRAIDHEATYEIQERDIVRLLLEYGTLKKKDEKPGTIIPAGEIIQVIVDEFKEMELKNPTYNHILNEFKEALKANNIPEEMHFINHPDKTVSNATIDILLSPYELSHNWFDKHGITVTEKRFIYRNDIKDTFLSFKIKYFIKLEKAIREKLKTLTDEKEITREQTNLKRILKVRMDLAKDRGTVVLY
jgi:DNA primase